MSQGLLAELASALLDIAGRDDATSALSRFDWPLEALEAMAEAPEPGRPYGRRLLGSNGHGEVLLMSWAPGLRCAAHDHADSSGHVVVLRGELCERRLRLRGTSLEVVREASARALGVLPTPRGVVHDMLATGPALSVHIYTPAIDRMRVFDPAARQTLTVDANHGAWLPDGPAQVIDAAAWSPDDVVIVYTTRYREGGPRFAQVARTLARDKRVEHPDANVRCVRVECKRDFVDAITRDGRAIRELHFVGHSGMYGPMFGTRAMPEQFSPDEWRTLSIPFARDAAAYFHCCRSARWFAPFFARTFDVPAHGYHWYTSFSGRKDGFRWQRQSTGPLYVVGCPGRTSHGLVGSLGKYTGLVAAEAMKRFEPASTGGAESYDRVAELYDEAYADVRVRAREWSWLTRHLPSRPPPRVLDIGSGNGSLLEQLADRIASGRGVDAAARMVELARDRCAHIDHVDFERVTGPTLPFADDSFDVVISFLSFRYLDWDPILLEIVRTLRPGGRLLIVDMVARPVRWRETGRLLASKARLARLRRRNPEFAARLGRLVSHPRWAEMLEHNPIRSEHELSWYLESRFPGRKVEVLDVGFHSRVLAFDTGPIGSDYLPPQSYP